MFPSWERAALPRSCSGSTRLATWVGPTTACTPGSAASRFWKCSIAASGLGSVIGPSSVTATIWKGASQPGPIARSISSAFWRAVEPFASSSGLGAAPTTAINLESPAPAGLPIRQRSTLGPSRVSSAVPTTVATVTLRSTTMISVPASEASSEPGRMNSETTIESISVLPANIVVRPAVRRVRRAASAGAAPPASSSRKRETINSA